MNIPYKWPALILLLVLALVCYSLGAVKSAIIFIILGLVFEMAFWLGLFKRVNKPSSTVKP